MKDPKETKVDLVTYVRNHGAENIVVQKEKNYTKITYALNISHHGVITINAREEK